jgi:hypothetical protein
MKLGGVLLNYCESGAKGKVARPFWFQVVKFLDARPMSVSSKWRLAYGLETT